MTIHEWVANTRMKGGIREFVVLLVLSLSKYSRMVFTGGEARQYPDGHTSAWEREIDELVAARQWYGLTDEEKDIVEGR